MVLNTAVISGGEKLERKLAAIARNAKNAANLKVGFLENAKYPKGTNVALVAAVQEFGSTKLGIPPRPFFRNMVKDKQKEWPAAIAGLLKNNDYDSQKTLTQTGHAIVGQLKKSIIDTNTPPLSPVTLLVRQIVGPNGTPTFADVLEARRRYAAGERASGVSEKPLVWTSHLLNSADFEVE